MKKNSSAAQLYTVREFLKDYKGIKKSLKKIANIGYEAVQLSGLDSIDPCRLRDILNRNRLKACATHTSYNRLINDLESVVKEHKLWECDFVGLGSMPNRYKENKEGYKTFADEISELGKKLADNGLTFIYHNHNFEFAKFNGATGLEILINETDPDYVEFELDTYWIQAGGADPVEWIRKVEGRMSVVHFKDMKATVDRRQIMTEVGEGNLNWKEIIKACKDVGVKWYAVEQDTCERDPFESLAISYNNLKNMGVY